MFLEPYQVNEILSIDLIAMLNIINVVKTNIRTDSPIL